MKYSKDLVIRSQEIVKQVKEAERLNKPIDNLVREQIAIMECQKDEFVKQADNLGFDDLGKARVEIGIYSNIKFWAQKIGLPVDKYDSKIKELRIKNLGAEFVKENFGD